MIRVTSNIVRKFSGLNIKIPQQQEGDKLCQSGKYNLAINSYIRVVEIMNSIKLNQKPNSQYLDAIVKLAACEFINNKNLAVNNTLNMIDLKNVNEKYRNYFLFLKETNNLIIQNQSKNQTSNLNQSNQIKELISRLLKKNQTNSKYNSIENKFPVLSKISQILNNRVDYRKYLISLIQRSPIKQKSFLSIEWLSKVPIYKPSTQLQLLLYMGMILENKTLALADKAFINERVNQILKDYQTNRHKEVYKPLLVIIISLIGEKHYMSAEGMVGHVKTEQLSLINNYQSQDKALVNNIYRMLVTRANNQPFELGWTKQEPVFLGNLVVERIIKAPLLGHTIEGLIR